MELLKYCVTVRKPLIIDADGLFVLNENIDLIYGKQNVILTPNAIEFKRLFGEDPLLAMDKITPLGEGVLVLEKGLTDKIYIPHTKEIYSMPIGGSGRRCGGQGDLLSGSIATFFFWTLQSNQPNPAYLAACASSHFVKKLNLAAFDKLGRGMVASDMIIEIPTIFHDIFE